MHKILITCGILCMLGLLDACATSTTTASPIGDCGIVCRGGDVDYFKSRDLECQCQERVGLD